MMKYLPLILIIVLLSSCNPGKDPLTNDEIAKEKESVKQVIKVYNKAIEEENFAALLPTLSQDVSFFGTDSAEIITSLNEFKKKITDQFKQVENTKYGPMSDISIQMDNYGTYASIIFGMPVDMLLNGVPIHMFLRVARTLKKEDGKWVIVSGIIGVAGGTSNSVKNENHAPVETK